MAADGLRYELPRWVLVLAAALIQAALPLAAETSRSQLGLEVAVPRHLQDGDEFALPLPQLLAHGQTLFTAAWTSQEGGGRPLSKGTGAPLADLATPLRFPHNFNRISGPDANSCAGCHHQPFGIAGGSGDVATNVFVQAQRFDRVDFALDNPTATVSSVEEAGRAVTLATVGNLRATVGMFGAGYLEMLARQITAELQAIRDRIPPGGAAELVAKGISFGILRRVEDGRFNTSQVHGLPPASLASFGGYTDPPSLLVRPFHQSGALASLREFTLNALNHHHGIQASERFGPGLDPDGDGFVDEVTRADVTALTLYQATMAVPGRVIPRDRTVEAAVGLGEQKFAAIGCARCHIPRLPLTGVGHVFVEPGPQPPKEPWRRWPAATLRVDLNDPTLPLPRLAAEDGVTWVPAYTDFKLHDITEGPLDPNREPLDMSQPAGLGGFFAGNSRFLTSRLWGVANQPPYFHHGKFTTLREAILAHAGEAADVTAAFVASDELEQAAIIEFLKSLQVLLPGTRAQVIDERGVPRPWPLP